mgnify:CR=1 FL=1
MLLVVLKNVLCVVADGLSKNVDFFIVRKNIFTVKKSIFITMKTVYLEEVPLSNMLTMENNVKQIAPSPANTRAGMA